MNTCRFCGKKITGRATKRYCSKAHKQAAARSRKKTEVKSKSNAITSAELQDLTYIEQFSPDAKRKLLEVHAKHGKDTFLLALDATYTAVVDTQEIPV